MALSFRHFKQILEDGLSYFIGHSEVSDTNPGSITRTLFEAFALEASLIYVQLQTILNLFSLDKASGEDLDERALDFDATREQPTKSTGALTIGDSNLTVGDTAFSTTDAPLTATVSTQVQIQDVDFASFPASGTVIIDRAGVNREDLVYTSKTGPDLLNLSGTPVNSHLTGVTVHLSTVGADRPVPLGTVVKTGAAPDLEFETTVDTTLLDGDYQITNVTARSLETGADNNVSGCRITKFDAPPFPTATVANPTNFVGGRDLETDEAFRARIKEEQQSLSSSTKLRIESEALQVELTTTGQRVITANLVEPITAGNSTLYINDGTSTYSPTTVDISVTEVLISLAEEGHLRSELENWPIVSNSEQLFLNIDKGTTTAVGVDSLTDTGQAWGVNIYAGMQVKDVNDVLYDIVSNTATVLTLSGGFTPAAGTYTIFDDSATVWPTGSKLVKNTDYIINDTNGQLELDSTVFPTGLSAGDSLLAFYNGVTSAYSYYDGLLQEVQKVLNGDPDDRVTYPGVKAAGTFVTITEPTIVVITVVGSLSSVKGVVESTLYTAVKQAILDYINNLDIGEDVLLSRIIEAAVSVPGVFDFSLSIPSANTIVTDVQLAKTTISDITVT